MSIEDDERDMGNEAAAADEERLYRVTDILRRLADGVKVDRCDVEVLCFECGVPKNLVFEDAKSLAAPEVEDFDPTGELPF